MAAALPVLAVLVTVWVAGCTYSVETPFPAGSPAAAGESTPWSGSWESNWGPMEITQSGNQVTGTYTHNDGRINGTVSGNTLTGMWSEAPTYSLPNDAGDLVFTFAADGKSFTGNWRYGSGTGTWDGSWTATRK